MASKYVPGTYNIYKAGTTRVLQWLYNSALQCGYGVEQTDDENKKGDDMATRPKKKSKSKLKPRKGKGSKAKGSGKARSGKPNTDDDFSPVQVGVNEFVILAETIASPKPKVKIPLWVTSMIEQVITGRKKSARWFSRQAGDTTSNDFEESNQSYQHFIEVLEKVLALLVNLQEPGSARPAGKVDPSGQEDPLENFTNMFATLEVEPDTEHTMTEPEVSLPEARKTRNVVFEEERSMDETLWLIYCFFEDFNNTREHLKDLWTTYKCGKIDLTTAALSTNTAFELFQRSEKELLAELRNTLPPERMDDIKSYVEVQAFLMTTVALARGEDPHPSARRSPGDPYNYRLWDIADWIGPPVYIILLSFLPVYQPGSVPICKPGHFGILNLSEDLLYPDQKFQQDEIVLLERFIPEIIFLLNVKSPNGTVKLPAEDELTGAVLEMIRTKRSQYGSSLPVKSSELDIHYVMLEDMNRPFNELSSAATRVTGVVKRYQDFSRDMHIGHWPKHNTNEQLLIAVDWEMNQYILTDFLDPLRETAYQNNGLTKKGSHVLLKRHPVLCGLMLFRTNLIMQQVGLALVNAWGGLPTVLHLYNACLSQGLLRQPWIDLEALIIAHTPRRIFVGDRPNTPQEYLKRFMLVMGYSATIFSANKRANNGRFTASKQGPRQMLTNPVLSELYGERYLKVFESRSDHRTERPSFTLEAIEKLLAEAAPDHYSTAEEESPSAMEQALRTSLPETRPKDHLASNFAKSRKLTPIQLLRALENSMTKEAFAFNVDYLALHMRAFRLLRSIAAELDAMFVQYFGPMYCEKESELPFLVGSVFQAVSGSSQEIEVRFPKADPREHGSRMLIQVSEIVARFIEREGEIEVNHVKKICSRFGGVEFKVL
ncbi:hypothetical protein VTL71DRAFT_11336 [Oculimacula yallundae]|uniref:DUF6604 domain-containing protein n=1 Tax=Oculimacula yallundae TaxID=86028 RepID=A0ABR4CRJ3_9HELO